MKLLIIDDSPPVDQQHGDLLAEGNFNAAFCLLGIAVAVNGGESRIACYRSYRDIIKNFNPDVIISDMRHIDFFLDLIELNNSRAKIIYFEHYPYWGNLFDVQWIEDWEKIYEMLKRIDGYAPVTRSDYITPILHSINPKCRIFPYWFAFPFPDNIDQVILDIPDRQVISGSGNLAYCGQLIKQRGGDRKWVMAATIAAASCRYTPLITLVGDYNSQIFEKILNEVADSRVIIVGGMARLDFLKNVLPKSDICISLPYNPPAATLTVRDSALLAIPCISTPVEVAFDLFPELVVTGPIIDEIVEKIQFIQTNNVIGERARKKSLSQNYSAAFSLLEEFLNA